MSRGSKRITDQRLIRAFRSALRSATEQMEPAIEAGALARQERDRYRPTTRSGEFMLPDGSYVRVTIWVEYTPSDTNERGQRLLAGSDER
jgi:hypothetical protein